MEEGRKGGWGAKRKERIFEVLYVTSEGRQGTGRMRHCLLPSLTQMASGLWVEELRCGVQAELPWDTHKCNPACPSPMFL
jgi:hypothetical protein